MPLMPDQVTVSQIVGANIRRIRVWKRIRQEDLAELAGLHKTTMYRIENGLRPSMELASLERIAGALGVRMATLLRGCP
jgi:transcriptional regulator with XRE-family HTH domain